MAVLMQKGVHQAEGRGPAGYGKGRRDLLTHDIPESYVFSDLFFDHIQLFLGTSHMDDDDSSGIDPLLIPETVSDEMFPGLFPGPHMHSAKHHPALFHAENRVQEKGAAQDMQP